MPPLVLCEYFLSHLNHGSVKIPAVQPLTTAITKSHILPLNRTQTTGTFREARITPPIIHNLLDRHRAAVTLSASRFLVCTPGRVPSSGLFSHCHSNTPFLFQQSLYAGKNSIPTNKKQFRQLILDFATQSPKQRTRPLLEKAVSSVLHVYPSSVIEQCSARSFLTFFLARDSSTRTLSWVMCKTAPISRVVRSRKYFPSSR